MKGKKMKTRILSLMLAVTVVAGLVVFALPQRVSAANFQFITDIRLAAGEGAYDELEADGYRVMTVGLNSEAEEAEQLYKYYQHTFTPIPLMIVDEADIVEYLTDERGNPILADSLTLQYGSSEMPKGCTQPLHFFCYTNAVDLGDTAYSYNNKINGVYFFWDVDTQALAGSTGSVFTGGHLALVGIGGFILGILGATFVFLPKRRKEEVI